MCYLYKINIMCGIVVSMGNRDLGFVITKDA